VDNLLYNANIYSTDEINATAIALHEGRIVGIGSEEDMRISFDFKEQEDLNGAYVYPGFHDAHCHFTGLALVLMSADLRSSTDQKHMVKLLLDWYIAFQTEGKTLERLDGWGWDQNNWKSKEMPNRTELDSLFPNMPVVLRRIDGHALLLNEAAMQKFGLLKDGLPTSKLLEVEEGWVTGILNENAQNLVPPARPQASYYLEALQKAEDICFSLGITRLTDAGLDTNELLMLERFYARNELRIPLYCMASDNENSLAYFLERGKIDKENFKVKAFKFYYDGALGSRGALLSSPYEDKEAHFGYSLQSMEDFVMKLKRIDQAGFQACVHTIGDSSAHATFLAFSSVLEKGNDKRWRLEHSQVVAERDLPYFNSLAVLPSIQPTHATSDMGWAESRLGKQRLEWAYRAKSFLDYSEVLPLGTDFPVEGLNPLMTFYAAVSRRNPEGEPLKGFRPSEALSREQALKGMTLDAAFASFQEKETGSITVGKLADLTILDTDLMNCNLQDLKKTKVLQTWSNGSRVYTQKPD
jgi:predicted amidohydrolase YtcJ